MDNEIVLPNLDWLIGGSRIGGTYNKYFASVGTDPMKGCFAEKIYNYGIWIEKDEQTEKETLETVVYDGMNSYENCDKERQKTNWFELSEEGRLEAKKWVSETIQGLKNEN